jgi:Ca-activated chloride channel homolog
MKTLFASFGFTLACASLALGGETIQLRVEPEQRIVITGEPQEVVVKIDLTATKTAKAKRTPLNLAVVLDRSGSMTGAKIEKARQAASGLVDQLQEGDVFSLISYSSSVEVLVHASAVEDKRALKRIIEGITASGNTALHAGVERGAGELQRYFSKKKINRVILLSDGLANVGPSSPQELRRLGSRLAEEGIAVTTIGVGDDYNEDLMSGLAEASDANYYYVKDTEKLPEIFARELGQLLDVAAREIRIEINCPHGIRPLGFLGRPEKFEGQKATVTFNNLVSGQNRYLFLRCRAEETEKTAAREIASVKVHYLDEIKGNEVTAVETVTVAFTPDARSARSSVNREVQAQKELIVTATVKDAALSHADKGDYKNACRVMNEQAGKLLDCAAQAPAQVRSQLEQEAQLLQSRAADLQKGNYSSGLRKTQQSESWNYRNAK